MLLQHTSGVFNFTGETDPDGTIVPGIPAMGKEWVDNRFHTYRPQELVELALRTPAGTRWPTPPASIPPGSPAPVT